MQNAKLQQAVNLSNKMPGSRVCDLAQCGEPCCVDAADCLSICSACCWFNEVMLQEAGRLQPGMPGQQAAGGGSARQPA